MPACLRGCLCCAFVLVNCAAADAPRAAGVAAQLANSTLDPARTYRVRDLQLSRGDIRIYLTDGLLSFITPAAGRTFAAVFTVAGSDTGDAEVLVLPPQRAERASLASFTDSPNLDEHFSSALFLFSDDTAPELLAQIEKSPVRKAPDLAAQLAPKVNPAVQQVLSQLNVHLIESLLDNHAPADGFLYSLLIGRHLGDFDVLWEPSQFEPVSIGRLAESSAGTSFQLWTSFRPRRFPPFAPPSANISGYQIDTTIHPDLSMASTARFQLVPSPDAGRVLSFVMSEKLRVLTGSIDGTPVEVFQSGSSRGPTVKTIGTFLLISPSPILPGRPHTIEVRYEGSVIRHPEKGSYFVDERNTWYPSAGSTFASFDLTFRCPENLRLVSTGEPVTEDVADGVRVVHRKTQVPEHLAGFNLGEYEFAAGQHGRYRVESFSNASAPREDPNEILNQTENILDDYTRRWTVLPIHSVAVSPVPGYFGQGFPGLIYLSTISYLRPEDRPAQLRNPRLDTFFSEMLLPHEIAHQWWGNLVSPLNYRANWLMEAMADYSALEFVERAKGTPALDALLQQYRDDLLRQESGKSIESAGPVDFGPRLLDNNGVLAWHVVIYEKGAWILHMLRQRLGDDAFNRMQVRLLQQFSSQPISNEDFRKLLSEFVPPGQPDKSLAMFFDAWVYGTGIPKLALHRDDLEVSGVDDDFSFDLPLHCRAGGKEQVRWVRAAAGSNPLEPSTGKNCELPSASEFLYAPK